jgi:hypothetical protein
MSFKALELTGRRVGFLTVLERVPSKGRNSLWRCLCDCGGIVVAKAAPLNNGTTSSCGCQKIKHGDCRVGTYVPEYWIWAQMRHRCRNSNYHSWKNYGGRGIQICDAWADSYEAFLRDMGRRPSPKHSVDRINNDGHYEPGNCRWATRDQQNRNSRHVKLTIDDVIAIRAAAARGARNRELVAKYGVSSGTISNIVAGRIWKNLEVPLRASVAA